MTLHLAPNAPWLLLALAILASAALAVWAYRFAVPPLPALAKRALPFLRWGALAVLLLLLAQPVIERFGSGGSRLVVLVDRSRSMSLPAGGRGGETRRAAADRAVEELRRTWRGRAAVDVVPFGRRLGSDSVRVEGESATALGDALETLGHSPAGEHASGVVVVSDGAVNAGQDPVTAAREIGVPVHTVLIGSDALSDRGVTGVESPADARVGQTATVHVRVSTTESRGTPVGVRLLEGGRELGRATVVAPGGGAEASAEFRVTPVRPGLAVWTARIDSLAGEISTANNARQIALEVAPGRLGVTLVSSGLNWDLGFLRRALLGDSSLAVRTWVRERGGWRALEGARGAGAPRLGGQSVLVLDGIAPSEVAPAFDAEVTSFARRGGGVLVFSGSAPGLARFRGQSFGRELGLVINAAGAPPRSAPMPSPGARELLAWDDDPARGERAWRAAAPLSDLVALAPAGGDRVLVGSAAGGPALLLVRRVGRGQALLVNGTGIWRWSLSGHDDLTAERGRRLWRRLVHWLAEPVQGEPLRVRPERWLTGSGESVRLFATLQDQTFRPVAGATVEGQVQDAAGRARKIEFAPGAAGSYVATIEDPAPGRYRVSASATRGGSGLGNATTEFAVDRWSLEEARTMPDSATLAAVASASGGSTTGAREVGRWARSLDTRARSRTRTASLRLWESPWVFAFVVGCLSLEWAWRRRRGLP